MAGLTNRSLGTDAVFGPDAVLTAFTSCEQVQAPFGGYFCALMINVFFTWRTAACAFAVAWLVAFAWYANAPVLTVTVALALASVLLALSMDFQHWYYHLYPNVSCASRRVKVRVHHVQPKRKVLEALVTLPAVETRGFSTVGMSLWSYMRDQYTYGLEYRIQALLSLVAVDLGLDDEKYKRAPTAQALYHFIMNTSLACFIDAEIGHVVLYGA